MAYRKTLWSRAGGWPEWAFFSEDTLFDHRIRRLQIEWRFAGDAVVWWRPRSSLRAISRQFYNYGTGRGHTKIDAESYTYNLRNLAVVLILGACSLATSLAFPVLVLALLYFYVWTFHDKAVRIARRSGSWTAYPLCLCVIWTVMASSLTGYLFGSWQRRRNPAVYQQRMEVYLAGL